MEPVDKVSIQDFLMKGLGGGPPRDVALNLLQLRESKVNKNKTPDEYFLSDNTHRNFSSIIFKKEAGGTTHYCLQKSMIHD